MPPIVFDIFFPCLIVVAAVGFGLHSLVIGRLHRYHRELWQSMGSPGFLYTGAYKRGKKLQRFLWDGGFRKLDDETLTMLCESELVAMALYGFVILMILLMAVLEAVDKYWT